MKVILILAVVVALAMSSPLNLEKVDNLIKFDLDVHQDIPIGLVMKGQIDPRNEQMNKIQTFLRLAGEYIPVLESMANAENDLTWERHWHVGIMGFNTDISFFFQLIVGWRVSPGGQTADRFDVTYTPFVWGGTWGTVNGTSWPAVGSIEAGIQYVLAYAPISLSLFSNGRVCFRGSYAVEPVHIRQHMFLALNACQDEILDDLINGRVPLINWQCNFTNPVNVTVWDENITTGIYGDFIGETCIDF